MCHKLTFHIDMGTTHVYDLTFISGSGQDGDEASDHSSRLCSNICECDTTGYFWDPGMISKQVSKFPFVSMEKHADVQSVVPTTSQKCVIWSTFASK